jgi:DNA-binding NarL/FixJ family response regulator
VKSSTVRLLVVDNYQPWRRFVALALTVKPYIQVVGEAEDGITAIQKLTELQPDIVILDLCLPDAAGPEIARQMMKLAPQTKILFLAGLSSEEIVKKVLSSGAYGYVLKSEAARDLVPAVEALLVNDYFVSLGAIRSSSAEEPCFGKRRSDH